MRSFVLPLILIASLGASSAMAAADQTAKGPIKALDAKACTVTIDTAVYQFPAKCDFSKLKVGENVAITYQVNNNVNDASKIAPAA